MSSPGPNLEVPLIVHVVYALRMGGLENGLVNLINRIPPERYRHAVICLTDFDEFAERISRKDTELIEIHRREGKNPTLYLRLWQLLRRLRPDILHTRNIGTLEAQVPAALAGVRCRIHGEHGWDVLDLDGSNPRYRWLRRRCRSLVHRYIPVSRELESYLRERIDVPARRITRICNGVDTERFRPSPNGRESLPLAGLSADTVVVGTVGRMEAVKDPLNLVHAYLLLLEQHPGWRHRLRLVMVGGGSLHQQVRAALKEGRALETAWLPGARDDVPALLRGLDVFVLPSLAEGVSNTLLEAMSTALPVVATRVGGNADLVVEEKTGLLVPPADPRALAESLAIFVKSAEARRSHGRAARARAEREFSLDRMTIEYLNVYDSVFKSKGKRQSLR